MQSHALPEGMPILCRHCGSTMAFVGPTAVQCGHCRAVDTLPAGDAARVVELKHRLALAEQRALQVRGVDATLATIFEDRSAFLRVAGLYLVVALVISASAISQLVSLPAEKIPPAALVEVIAASSTAPVLVLGIALSLALSFAYGRWHYRKLLRPLLLARVPAGEGARARCRVCGGDLPPTRGVDSRCSYCRSVNIIPKALHGAQAQALQAEGDALRAKLAGANVATMSIARRMRFALIGLVALTFALAFAMPALTRALLGLVFG
jgi:hypothetical protein